MFPRTDILVCQADSCRRAGSEAVLCEIEELARWETSRFSLWFRSTIEVPIHKYASPKRKPSIEELAKRTPKP